MGPQKKKEAVLLRFSFVFKIYTKDKKNVYLLSFFSLGMLELLPLLADLELSPLASGSGNRSSITLAVGGEMGMESSSDLEQERVSCKLKVKCTSKRPFYWQKEIHFFNSISN